MSDAHTLIMHTLRINRDRLASLPAGTIAQGLVDALEQAGYEIRQPPAAIVWDGSDEAFESICDTVIEPADTPGGQTWGVSSHEDELELTQYLDDDKEVSLKLTLGWSVAPGPVVLPPEAVTE